MIDVAISSCSRIDILEKAIMSFRKNIISSNKFRFIICEDKVDNVERQEIGKKWILDHKYLFDEIIFSNKKLTYVYCYSEILKYIETEYFFRLEDDVIFPHKICIDPIIKFMKKNKNLSHVSFKRGNKEHNIINKKLIGIVNGDCIYNYDFFSVATGIHNLKICKEIVDLSNGECHEARILTPNMLKLNKNGAAICKNENDGYVLCTGEDKGYIKGKWRI